MKKDSQLAQELRAMTDAELSRSSRPDVDLVEAYVDAILELDGVEPETDEEVRRGIETVLKKGAQQHTRKRRRIRFALIAAIIAVLAAASSLSFLSLSGGTNELAIKLAPFLSRQKPGYTIELGDYMTLSSGGKPIQYDTVREYVRKGGPDVLVPTVLPDDTDLQDIWVVYDQLYACMSVSFHTYDPSVSVSAKIGFLFEGLENYERMEKIGGHDCGVAFSEEQVQCDFNYDGNGYTVCAHTYEDLLAVVDGLRDASKLYAKK